MDTSRQNSVPVISYAGDDGALVELLYDPAARKTSLAVRAPSGAISVEQSYDAGDRTFRPYRASNNLIATGCVLFPSAVGEPRPKDALLADIRAYLHRNVDLSPVFEEITAHYVLLSWCCDGFNELGYLRFRGDYGTGKTRALIALGSVCYKPFFASGASTVSPIFHVLDAFGGTLVLDEADLRFSDATADLTKILNNGNVRGLPVLRTMANRHHEFSPRAFRVFGPKIVAMRSSFDDPALESRFITEETGGRPLRPDIPVDLPKSLAEDALRLRNDLLAWRFASHGKISPRPEHALKGVEPRFSQTSLALLSLVDDGPARERIAAELAQQAARSVEDRASTIDAALLQALVDAFEATREPHVTIADLTARFNRAARDHLYQPATNRRVGWLLRNALRLKTTKSRGVYVVPQTERTRIETLAVRHGVVVPKNTRAQTQ